MVAGHIADGNFEQVPKAAAVRVGSGEVAAQQADDRVLGQLVGPRLVPQNGPNVTADGRGIPPKYVSIRLMPGTEVRLLPFRYDVTSAIWAQLAPLACRPVCVRRA